MEHVSKITKRVLEGIADRKKQGDTAKMAAMVSAMFAVVEGDSAENIEQRARFYRLVPGIHWPDDWDELDLAEKKKRLDAMDKFGLDT